MADAKIGGDVKAALALAALLICLATLVGETAVGMIVSPLVFALVVYAMSRVPIRYSMLALMFFALTLQNPAEDNPTGDDWSPPFHSVGAALLTHLNAVDPSIPSWCSFSGLDLFFLALGIIALQRRSSGSKIDSADRLPTPQPLRRLAWVALGGALYVWVSGMIRGGDFSMSLWQLNKVVYLPLIFLLFQAGLRGPRDHAAIVRVVLVAATYKALLAMYVMNNFHGAIDPDTGSDRLPFATTHADSMLFADAFIMILAGLLERTGRKTKWLALFLLPILAGGMMANNRRIVWVQVGLVFLTVYVVAEDGPVKRFIRRSILVLSPVIAGYILVGWNGGGPLFKPVKLLRSVVDAKSDGSTFWREMENFDLISTIKLNPIFGTGFGHGYEEVVQLPAIGYTLERYVPHNGILGLWCYCGYFGYAALTLLWAGGVYFAMRAYHATKVPMQRAGALVSFGAVVVYLMQCWGDLGLGSWTGVFTVGCAVANAGKLCVATGQWPAGSGKNPASPLGGQAARARA
jgi:hypothetical protein